MRALVAAVLVAAAVLTNSQHAAAAPASFSSTIATGPATTCAGVPGGAPTAALQLTTSACSVATSRRFSFSQVSTDVYTIVALGTQLPVPSGEPAS